MGGHTSKSDRKSASLKRKQRIQSYAEEFFPDIPDVETLGLSFDICKKIFAQVSLADISSCMLVCKEWRSLIDTAAFWRAFVAHHYDFSLRDPKRGTFMCLWKHNAPVCRGGFGQYASFSRPKEPQPDSDEYVFQPFPDIWRCGVVVPHAMHPPDGSIITYHFFIQAMHWTQKLRWKIKVCRLQSQLRVCLFQWKLMRMPSGKEVLDILNAHDDLVSSVIETRELTRDELKNYFTLLKDRFDFDFYCWFVERVWDRAIVCDCSKEDVQPAPCFILSHVSPGWVGGLLYAI